MSDAALAPAGRGTAHDNLQPYAVLLYCIATAGIFPMGASLMPEPYYGEIRPWAAKRVPTGWMACDGQLLDISAHTALYSILGTRFGGNGRTTFALPDLRGRVPLHRGAGDGLTDRVFGVPGGDEKVPLARDQMPLHGHEALANRSVPATATVPSPAGAVWAKGGGAYKKAVPSGVAPLHANAVESVGSGQPHNKVQPHLALTFIVCISGLYPQRT